MSWQFWSHFQKTQQHVFSAKVRCAGRTLVSLRLHPFLGQSVSPPWITPPGFNSNWSSAMDNLCDRLTSVKRVKYYISAGPVTSSYFMAISGLHGHAHQHLVHICGIQYPSGTVSSHSGSVDVTVFTLRSPNRCRNLFHLSQFNIITYSCSKYRPHMLPSNKVPLIYRNMLHFGISQFSKNTLFTVVTIGCDVGVSSPPTVAGVLLGTLYATCNSKQISSLVLVPVLC